MTTIPITIASAVIAFFLFTGVAQPVYAQDSDARETTRSAELADMTWNERFSAAKPDSQGCRRAVFGETPRLYPLYRDDFLIAEARWLYCTGSIDYLPKWAR